MTTALTGPSTDQETARAGGFDIVRSTVDGSLWARPDNARVERGAMYVPRHRSYWAVRADGERGHFFSMAEAVAWIGPVLSCDPERLHFVEPGEDDR